MPNNYSGGMARGLSDALTNFMAQRQMREQQNYERTQAAQRSAQEQARYEAERAYRQQRDTAADAQRAQEFGLQQQSAQRADETHTTNMQDEGRERYIPGALENASGGMLPGPFSSLTPLANFLNEQATKQTTKPGQWTKVRPSVRENELKSAQDARSTSEYQQNQRDDAKTAASQKFTLDRDEQNFRQQKELQRMQDSAMAQRQASAPSRRATPQDFTASRQLRTEYEKAIAPHLEAARSLADLRASANAPPSAQGDIALTYKFMKTLDPTSTVREGEYATAKNAGSVGDRFRNMYNSVRNGQFLTPEQRKEMLNVAQSRVSGLRPQMQQAMQRYSQMAEEFGLDPRHVVYDPYGEEEAKVPPPAAFLPRDGAPPTQVPVKRPLGAFDRGGR